jgi:hypothetical protein
MSMSLISIFKGSGRAATIWRVLSATAWLASSAALTWTFFGLAWSLRGDVLGE